MKTTALIIALALAILVPSQTNAKISIQTAENIIGEFTYQYKNEILQDGKGYVVNKKWNVKSFDLSIKNNKNSIVLSITKGAIDNKRMTGDTFRLILCHEFGHYFGGAPKKRESHWASNEGQSDYYATSKCIKRIIKDDNMYERAKIAALRFGQILAELNHEDPNKISLMARDLSEVNQTTVEHPSAQCRVDTLIAGLNCPIDESVEFSNTNPNIGACSNSSINEVIAAGARPRCWYRPKVLGKFCQSTELVPGQKIPLVTIFVKNYKDDFTASLSGIVGVLAPANQISEKVKRLNTNERFESLKQKIIVDRNQLFIDKSMFKSFAQKSLVPIKFESLKLKSQGSDLVLNLTCKDL